MAGWMPAGDGAMCGACRLEETSDLKGAPIAYLFERGKRSGINDSENVEAFGLNLGKSRDLTVPRNRRVCDAPRRIDMN